MAHAQLGPPRSRGLRPPCPNHAWSRLRAARRTPFSLAGRWRRHRAASATSASRYKRGRPPPPLVGFFGGGSNPCLAVVARPNTSRVVDAFRGQGSSGRARPAATRKRRRPMGTHYIVCRSRVAWYNKVIVATYHAPHSPGSAAPSLSDVSSAASSALAFSSAFFFFLRRFFSLRLCSSSCASATATSAAFFFFRHQ